MEGRLRSKLLFLLDSWSLEPTTEPCNILVVTHLPCLMALDQILRDPLSDIVIADESVDLARLPEQIGVLELQQDGVKWSGKIRGM